VLEGRLEGTKIGGGVLELLLQGTLDLEVLDLLLLAEEDLHFLLGLLNVGQHTLNLLVVLSNNLADLANPSLLVVDLTVANQDILLDGGEGNIELGLGLTRNLGGETTSWATTTAGGTIT